jgi:uroporphyrinogen III methyltransferase/synthase
VTGRERAGKEEPAIDYAALADFPGTLVFYMGVTSAESWTAALLEAGRSPDTPAAIIRRCSWPDQRTYACTLGTVSSTISQQRIRPPVVVIVGDVAATGPTYDWLSQRPLFGLRILVTRPEQQSADLADVLAELGADVLLQPAIEIAAPQDWSPVDKAIGELARYDWIVFSSANGVRAFLDRLILQGRDLRSLGVCRLAAIGPGTADELRRYHLTPDVVPAEFRAESLAAALEGAASGKRFLLIRASRGREILAETLTGAEADVTQVVTYESRDVVTPDAEVARLLEAGQIDWVTVTSSAIAHALVGMFGDALRSARLASLSPVTSATLAELGLPVAAEAREYTIAGLVAAVREAIGR